MMGTVGRVNSQTQQACGLKAKGAKKANEANRSLGCWCTIRLKSNIMFPFFREFCSPAKCGRYFVFCGSRFGVYIHLV